MSIRMVHSDDGLDEMHEINVTPFIDVMLVLLIVFMIAAPLATVSVPVDLPVSTSSPPQQQTEPVYITLQSDLSVSVGDQKVSRAQFAEALDRAAKGDKTARLLLRADREVNYGQLMALMNILREAGYFKVALVGIEPGQGTSEALK
jgi:TonB system transport protein ExbD (group 1)